MEEIRKYIDEIPSLPSSKEELELIMSLIDLTSLEGKDNTESITRLCEKAKKYNTAAVCVYPPFVSLTKKLLKGSHVKTATVAGAFPSGQLPLNLRLKEAAYALEEGADEIDMVISRGKFLEGDHAAVSEEVLAFKKIVGNKVLKVILETGELGSDENIRTAGNLAIDSGADFLKTSTGKIATNATLESVCRMLLTIKNSGKRIGIKPSGGISDASEAAKYIRLTQKILGEEWLKPKLFRLGASRLAENIYSQL